MRRFVSALWVCVLVGAGAARAQAPPDMPAPLWQAALAATLLDNSDLAFRNDYVPVDAARLPVVDRVMAAPMTLPSWLAETGRYPVDAALLPESPTGSASADVVDYWSWIFPADHKTSPRAVGRPGASAKGFPISLMPILAALKTVNVRPLATRSEFTDAVGHPADSIWQVLHVEFPELLWENPDEEFQTPEWQDSVQQAEEDLTRRLVPLVETVPVARIRNDANLVLRSFMAWAEGLAVTGLDPWRNLANPANARREYVTDYGRIAFGTTRSDDYRGTYAFIIDPGGDDSYELDYDSTCPSHVILDLGGNDVYRGESDAALAGGWWGTQILYDVDGDDIYSARSLDLGAGMFGCGVLIDGGGNDVYTGDTFVEGAGTFGVGVLIDSTGNDTYNGALFAQGFGFIRGAGVVLDGTGNDHYNAGGKYKDVLRYTDRYLSLSQGFAYGLRPFLSGGIGLLLDRAGNDDYNCDIFGQGASYWWGIGGLWDGAGNDRYLAFQYAQGAATHMTAAVLVDEAGDDIYFSKGVSQGCGHDLAPGLLWDLGGNDVYTGYDLSQGAGSANGLGVLFDATGDDRYYVKSNLNTQGYGNPRRDYGSIGLFLDGGGVDRYDGPGADSTWWRLDSKWGIGIDFDSTQVAR